MAYITQTEIEAHIGSSELAILTGDSSGSAVDTDRLESAIGRATALIDSFLQGRYDLPIAEPADEIISNIALDLIIADLYSAEFYESMMPTSIEMNRNRAIALLKDIQKGEIILDAHKSTSNAPPSIISNKNKQELKFTEKNLEKYSNIYK